MKDEGVIEFNIGFQISAAEMRHWHPDRIAQFFQGIAMALSARAGMPLEQRQAAENAYEDKESTADEGK